MAFYPDAAAARSGGEGGGAHGEARAVGLVAGEVVHFIVQRVRFDPKRRRLAREHGKRRAVAEADRTGVACGIGRGQRGVEDFQTVKTAGHEGAHKIEREYEHPVGEAGVQEARRVRESEVGGDTGVGEQVDVFAPAEFAGEQLVAGERRAVPHVARVVVAGVGVEAADAEIAARDEHRLARGTPTAGGDRRDEAMQIRQPARGHGFGHRGEEGERHGVAAVGAKHGEELQGAPAGE